MQHVFIIGSRGLPAQYGGFETFVEELVNHQVSTEIQYHVACLSDKQHTTHFDYKGADCFTIRPPKLGPARVIAYDMMAITYALSYCKKHQIINPQFYILGNTIGAVIKGYSKKLKRIGAKLYVNPDGLEWKRTKWSKPVQMYLKYSEKCMTKYADCIIADNLGIADYLKTQYPETRLKFIAYGTETSLSTLSSTEIVVRNFFEKWEVSEKGYYLVVGRFVPENNYETIIREFMATDTRKKLLIICNHDGNSFYNRLRDHTKFDTDKRVQFVGTVYDRELLTYIREHAFAYIHGHEVGGTNPGLLEAMAHTNLNLVLDVSFNRTVADISAFYWNKEPGNLRQLIMDSDFKTDYGQFGTRAKRIIAEKYTWGKIVSQYEELFLNAD